MNAHSDDIPMSHVEERPELDSADGKDSQSETRGSATVKNHEDAKTRLEKLLNRLNSATILKHMDTGSSLRMTIRWSNLALRKMMIKPQQMLSPHHQPRFLLRSRIGSHERHRTPSRVP